MEISRRYGGLEEFVYAAVSGRTSLSKDDFIRQLKEWELKPVEQDGLVVAVVMVKGNEVHVTVKDGYRGKWLGRGTIRTILGGILEECGSVTTSVSFGNALGREFVERLGFVPDAVTYTLEKLKHA